MIRCDGLDDLLDAAAVMSEQPLPTGSGVAIIANARGPLVVCADACTDSGLNVATLSEETQRALSERLPATSVVAGPVQLVASESPETFAAVAELVAADPGVDAVIAIFVEHIATGADDVAAALAGLSLPIPLLTVFMTPGNLPVDPAPRRDRPPRDRHAEPGGRAAPPRRAGSPPPPRREAAPSAPRRGRARRWRAAAPSRRRAAPRRARGAASAAPPRTPGARHGPPPRRRPAPRLAVAAAPLRTTDGSPRHAAAEGARSPRSAPPSAPPARSAAPPPTPVGARPP